MCGVGDAYGDFLSCLGVCSQGGGSSDFSNVVVSHGGNACVVLTVGEESVYLVGCWWLYVA